MIELATFLLQFAGFVALALSMPRHFREFFGSLPARSAKLSMRVVGWSLLTLAFIPAIFGAGASIGIVLWFGLATLAASVVALTLTYRNLWWRT